jgi:hypothetical protein
MLLQLMVSMLMVIIQPLITVLRLFTPQIIMVVQVQPTVVPPQPMRMSPPLDIIIKIAFLTMREVILVMMELLLMENLGVLNLGIIATMKLTLIITKVTLSMVLTVSLTLLDLEQIMLVITTMAITGEQAIKGM